MISTTPSAISHTEKSVVPWPMSATMITASVLTSMFEAIIAAVGSFITLWTVSPAIVPAFFVACLAASSNHAGHVITASVTSVPI